MKQKKETVLFNELGFTITELMIAATITLIFAGSFYAVFTAMQTQMVKQSVYYDTNRSIRYAMDRISKDIKESVSLVYSWGGVTRGDNTLILKLPSIDSNGVPTDITSQFDYVTYRLDPSDSTHLVRSLDVLNGTSQREGGTDKTNVLVAKRMQSLLFSYNGTNLGSIGSGTITTLKYINVNLTASGTTRGQSSSSQADSDIMLRNMIS